MTLDIGVIEVGLIEQEGPTHEQYVLACLAVGKPVCRENLFVVEVDDADTPVVGTLFEDSTNNRRLPGEGVFDVPAFLAAIHRIGHRGHWGVDIISEQHRQLPIREGLTRARAATFRALDAAEALGASAG